MGPTEAVRSVLSKYATFSGRSRRSEFWWFALFNLVVSVVLSLVDAGIGTKFPAYLVSLALIVPGLAVGVRRLHDTGKSGWLLLLGLIPIIGTIIVIVFEAQDSSPLPNVYGPSPKPALADPTWPQVPGTF